ncbi:hypothetical protein C8R45DRAFT_1098926 [Mycena sanguinolenta]|nr:hypothetical protein C8R45DRAFT_1098926 [Mycena sanguinolenta]
MSHRAAMMRVAMVAAQRQGFAHHPAAPNSHGGTYADPAVEVVRRVLLATSHQNSVSRTASASSLFPFAPLREHDRVHGTPAVDARVVVEPPAVARGRSHRSCARERSDMRTLKTMRQLCVPSISDSFQPQAARVGAPSCPSGEVSVGMRACSDGVAPRQFRDRATLLALRIFLAPPSMFPVSSPSPRLVVLTSPPTMPNFLSFLVNPLTEPKNNLVPATLQTGLLVVWFHPHPASRCLVHPSIHQCKENMYPAPRTPSHIWRPDSTLAPFFFIPSCLTFLSPALGC